MRVSTPIIAAFAILLGLSACSAGDEPAVEKGDPAAAMATAPPAEMPADAPPQEELPTPDAVLDATGVTSPADCLSDVGAAASARLVQRCIAVSPATRPPCNSANPCALIQGEIDRACAMYGPEETRPAECAA